MSLIFYFKRKKKEISSSKSRWKGLAFLKNKKDQRWRL